MGANNSLFWGRALCACRTCKVAYGDKNSWMGCPEELVASYAGRTSAHVAEPQLQCAFGNTRGNNN